MRNPLSLAALVYMAGVVIGNYFPGPLVWLIALALSLALVALCVRAWSKVALALALVTAGWANMSAATAVLSPVDLRVLVKAPPEYLTVRGTLTEAPVYREYERNQRLIGHTVAELCVSGIQRQESGSAAFGTVAVTVPGRLADAYFAGQNVEVTGVLQQPKSPTAPGQFDYRSYLRYRGVYFQLRCESTNDFRLARAPPGSPEHHPPFCDRFTAWAQRVLARGSFGEDEALRLIWAMVLGWKPALTQEIAEPFMESGTLHIFAISGLHIALIAGILVSVLRVVRVTRRACGVVVIPLIWFYTLATGWQASAIRSTVMMSVIIVGWALERPTNMLNSLAAAGLIILFGDPQQLFQPGFQLSFFVVLGLGLVVPPVERARRALLAPDPLLPAELRPKWKRWLDYPVRLVTTSVATSLAAWLGSMPLIAYYFYMITPGSLLANVVIVPLSSLALMSSLASVFCGDWAPYAGELFNHSSWLWMQLMIWLSQSFAGLPGAYFHVRSPNVWEFAGYYLLLGIVLSGGLWSVRWRVYTWTSSAVVVLAWIVCLVPSHSESVITILPVRGGSVFIDRAACRNDLLVNAGDASSAQSLIKPFLRSQGVNRISQLVLTHGELACVGGTDIIRTNFVVQQVVTSGMRSRSPIYRTLLNKLEQAPRKWRRIERSDRLGEWQVLHPAATDHLPQAHDNAVVLRGEIEGYSILLASKLGRLGQRALLEREPKLQADILVTTLYGQSETVTETFLSAVRPQLLVIGGGDFPASARPNGELRARLARLGVPVLYTSDVGAVRLVFRRRHCEARSMDGQRVDLTTTGGQNVTGQGRAAPQAREPS